MNSLTKHLYELAACIGLVVLMVAFSVWSGRFGKRAIEKWASAKGFTVINVRRRTFVPFWRPFSSKQFQFFRVTVRDSSGVDRRAWMRLESDCTEPEVLDVAWDEKTAAV